MIRKVIFRICFFLILEFPEKLLTHFQKFHREINKKMVQYYGNNSSKNLCFNSYIKDN